VRVRTYGQYCAAAKALDAVGDRWTLLVIRELLIGPRRYTDLLDGLPGISTDMLAARLRDLEDEGLIERRVLPPPAASKVYALTDDGSALEPILVALADWGARRLPADQDGEFRLHWLALSLRSMLVPAAAPANPVTVDFIVAGDRLRARVEHGSLSFEPNPTGHADVAIRGDPASLAGLATNREGRVAAIADGRVEVAGARTAIAAVQRAFGLEPRSTPATRRAAAQTVLTDPAVTQGRVPPASSPRPAG
jgi:DNA-binding HxlR family transcriptional regulator